MARIYDNSFFQRYVVWPTGYLAGRLAAVAGKDVERDEEAHCNFYLRQVELVIVGRISRAQQAILYADRDFRTKPIYMVTMHAPTAGKLIVERQFFVNASHLEKMGVTSGHILSCTQGETTSFQQTEGFDVYTLGQFWGNMRPRVKKVQESGTKASPDCPLSPSRRIKRNPLARFWLLK